MSDAWNDLLGCLELKTGDTDDVFSARSQDLQYHRVFGGQLLAQLMRAAVLTHPGKAVKSMHVLFPREGNSDEPLRYEVRREHEGGTFASLTIRAVQAKGTVAAAVLSLHTEEEGREQQAPYVVPHVPGPEAAAGLSIIPWETRSTGDLDTPAAGAPEYELWMRTPAVDAELAAPLTAYATDLTLIGTALRAIDGVGQRDAGKAFSSAVTSHSLWFHRPFRTDAWLLLRQEAPIVAHGRCFGRGDVLTESGALVASYAQEAMLRLK